MSSFTIDKNFQTPPPVCDFMAGLIPRKAYTIFEPTPGIGNIISAVTSNGRFHITAADDFFTFDHTRRFDAIIMNPPFSVKSAYIENVPSGSDFKGMKIGYHILKQCMGMSDNIIALMPWFTILDSDVRKRELNSYGIKSITDLPRKTFQYARIQVMILELQKGYKKETIYRTFDY